MKRKTEVLTEAILDDFFNNKMTMRELVQKYKFNVYNRVVSSIGEEAYQLQREINRQHAVSLNREKRLTALRRKIVAIEQSGGTLTMVYRKCKQKSLYRPDPNDKRSYYETLTDELKSLYGNDYMKFFHLKNYRSSPKFKKELEIYRLTKSGKHSVKEICETHKISKQCFYDIKERVKAALALGG